MRATGYILLAVAAALLGYVGISFLTLDAGTTNAAEALRADGAAPVSYWWVLLPAAFAAVAGVWFLSTHQRGYSLNRNPLQGPAV